MKENPKLSLGDFRNIAKEYILLFFTNESVHDAELLTDRNISLVLNLNVSDGLPLLYDAMRANTEFLQNGKKEKLAPDISFVIRMLNRCSNLMVPSCFAVGLIAVYLEVLKGCVIDYKGH